VDGVGHHGVVHQGDAQTLAILEAQGSASENLMPLNDHENFSM
jgi:hypothetical protein